MMIFIVLFLFATVALTYVISRSVYADMVAHRTFMNAKESFAAALAANEEMASRFVSGRSYDTTEVLTLMNATATSTIAYDSVSDVYTVTSEGHSQRAVRTSLISLALGDGASFNYGMQSDTGGIHLKNTASIRGNVFANGPVTGENSNIVRGEVISGGADGLIRGVHATGTAYAHTIEDSTIDGDAHYQVISNTDVGGALYPNSPDQGTSTLPITDEQVGEWKSAAEAGGTYSGVCPYVITADTTIGPMKIPCDLQVEGSPTITLAGHVWVEGNIVMQNTAHIALDDSLSGKSIAFIADYPLSPATKGIIDLKNSVTFEGAGERSYVVFVSQNTSAETGGALTAIRVQNSVSGDVLVYAAHGKIVLSNSIELKEVSAYRIEVQNSAEVVYESGLVNLLFTSGPGGGFTINSWREIE